MDRISTEFLKFHRTPGPPARFWIPLHLTTFLGLLLSIVFNWKDERRRKMLLIISGTWIVASIISAVYFVPQLSQLSALAKQNPVPAVFYILGKQWLNQSWGRMSLYIIAQMLLLYTLTIPFQESPVKS